MQNFYAITRYNHSKLYALAVFSLPKPFEKEPTMRIDGFPSRVSSRLTAKIALFAALASLAGCATVVERDGPPTEPSSQGLPPDPVPRAEPRSRYGNPLSYVVFGKRYHVLGSARGFVERGIASWYGKKFHGRRTSSGEIYDMHAMTAAHKSLPLPTYVSVLNLENYRRIIVRVNDRGPFHDNRIVDLSLSAAKRLGIVAKGTGYVEIRAIDPSQPPAAPTVHKVVDVARAEPTNSVKLFLQVGAFAIRANADRLMAQLGAIAGRLVSVSSAVSGGRTVYRVRLGPLSNVAQADSLAGAVVRLGMETPQVVLE